jgi:hypothetical protein
MGHWLDSIKNAGLWQNKFSDKKIILPKEIPKLESTTPPLLSRLYTRYFQGVKSELKTQALLLGVTSLEVNIHLLNVMYPAAGSPFEKKPAYDDLQGYLNFLAAGGPRAARTPIDWQLGKSMAHATPYGKSVNVIDLTVEDELVQATPPRAPMNGPVARKPFNQAPRQSFKALIRQSRRNR